MYAFYIFLPILYVFHSYFIFQLFYHFLFCFVLFAEKLKKNSSLKVKDSTNDVDPNHIAAQTFVFRELAATTKNFRGDCLLGGEVLVEYIKGD